MRVDTTMTLMGACLMVACSREPAALPDAGDAGDTAVLVAAADAGELPSDGGDGDAESDAGATHDAGLVEDAGPPLPSFAAEPFPEKPTALPSAEEWQGAPAVAIDRAHPPSLFAAHATARTGCRVRRVREWLRIHCTAMTGGAVLLGGNQAGLSIRFDKVDGGTEVIVPVRRGDRRVIEMLGSQTLARQVLSVERATFGFVISEQWPAGDDRPTIVAE